MVGSFFVAFTGLACNYYRIAVQQKYVSAAEERSELTVTAGISQGTIYDRNMKRMVNTGTKMAAVFVPTAGDNEEAAEYAVDRETFLSACEKGMPFVFDCKKGTPESDAMTVFEIPERYTDDMAACHVIGYLSENKGVTGIEYAYDSILRGDYGENTVTYQSDGFGRVLIGDGKTVVRSEADKGGAVTTIDLEIQRICEECGKDIKKGAIVAADVKTGDIVAMASFPAYNTEDIGAALSDEDSPLINRALYSYSVGSAFKLVTAAEALEEGYDSFMHNCTGNIDIGGQVFNCHKLDGHGLQDMTQALTNSCNTYFIDLSRTLDAEKLRELANGIGFGKENYLCAGITGSGGVLPSVKELSVPAELANFSFGQGRLTATPLQITQLTCAAANGGKVPVLRLIKGITIDGETVLNEKSPQLSQVMSEETAEQLRKMMVMAVRTNKSSNARTKNTSVGAKTSTAQTGRFDENGEELCNAWITGFFPSRRPEYALTVLVEDGGYGNEAAAPIFRDIADSVALLDR